jgi:hypothetical protein
MTAWRWEFFEDLVNEGACLVTNAGPLRTPIKSLSIKRNEERELVLTTTAAVDAHRSTNLYRAGVVRAADDIVEFASPSGFTAVARGVILHSWSGSHNLKEGSSTTTEESTVGSLAIAISHGGDARYTVEWIENLHTSGLIWPEGVTDKTKEITTTVVGRGPDVTTLTATSEGLSGRNQCVRLKVGGVDFFLGASDSDLSERLMRPGFILYEGQPDEAIREKIRNCLSFALGHYLIYLGCAVLDDACNAISVIAVNGDRLNDRAFRLPRQPPAPLAPGERKVDAIFLSRLVNGLYSAYDDLEFARLSWAYWHAVCASSHIAAAHFGAAIEALQASYVRSHPEQFKTKLVKDDKKWQKLQDQLMSVVASENLEDEIEGILSNKINGLNNMPQGKLSEQVFDHLGIPLGDAEKKAWKQRNLAAHGGPTDEDPVSVIKNTTLLRIVFHRLLLKMTNSSDMYRDYYSLDHPLRKLSEPVP